MPAFANDETAGPGAPRSRQAPQPLTDAFDRLAGGRTRTVASGAEIFGQGEPADLVYRILDGVVRTTRLLADGRRQVCDFLLAGDVLGPEAGLVHRTGAEAVTTVTFQAVPRRALAALADSDAQLAGDLWRLSVDWFQRSQDHALILGRQGAVERVAAFLLGYGERTGADRAVDLPMTRQDIADYLGLTIHTVSRTLSLLQAEGLVELESLRRIRLADVPGLHAVND